MKWIAFLPVTLALLLTVPARAQRPAPTLPLWMAGCWAGEVRGSRVEERWFQAGSAALVGVGTTMAKGALREFEFLRIVAEGATLSYVAQPGGRPPTTFAASSVSASEVVFQNAQNDFPKRVSYKRIAETLVAAIDNGTSDAARRQEFRLDRVSCDP